jgi:hypothetical protein
LVNVVPLMGLVFLLVVLLVFLDFRVVFLTGDPPKVCYLYTYSSILLVKPQVLNLLLGDREACLDIMCSLE